MTTDAAALAPTRAILVHDPTSPPLNSVAHASEHCAIDRRFSDALSTAVGRQILLRRSSGRSALYTIVDLVAATGGELHVGTAGAQRLGRADVLAARPDVTLTSRFISSDDSAPTRLTEQLLGDEGATSVAVLAPHGGRIEFGTDDQAHIVFDTLARAGVPARAWIARGYDPAGAYRCWHITSSEISEHSFPKLRALFDTPPRGRFSHAVAFHGHDDSEAIVIGGGLPADGTYTQLKRRLRSAIRRALESVTHEPPPIEVRLSGRLAGTERQNIVNRVTVAGNGIQLEQPLSVRQDCAQRTAIARAVGIFYAQLAAPAR